MSPRCAAAVGLLALLAVPPARAEVVQLTFEGLGNLAPVGGFYNGGAGGSYGITFAGGALALVDRDAGGTGEFGGEPSPSTILFFLEGSAVMNVAAGFDTGFSFYYTSPFEPGTVRVYGGPDGTGALLASILLPLTPLNGAPDPTGIYSPFVAAGVSFAGTARSVDFGGTSNQIGFDDITLGSATPDIAAIPEPGSLALLGAGLLGLAAAAGRRRPQRTRTSALAAAPAASSTVTR